MLNKFKALTVQGIRGQKFLIISKTHSPWGLVVQWRRQVIVGRANRVQLNSALGRRGWEPIQPKEYEETEQQGHFCARYKRLQQRCVGDVHPPHEAVKLRGGRCSASEHQALSRLGKATQGWCIQILPAWPRCFQHRVVGFPRATLPTFGQMEYSRLCFIQLYRASKSTIHTSQWYQCYNYK